jgi:hypothetical protein
MSPQDHAESVKDYCEMAQLVRKFEQDASWSGMHPLIEFAKLMTRYMDYCGWALAHDIDFRVPTAPFQKDDPALYEIRNAFSRSFLSMVQREYSRLPSLWQ